MHTFPLQIISPEGRIFSADAEGVTAWGVAGSFGVLANHAPMIAALLPGAVTVRTPEGDTFYAGGEGVLEVRPDKQVILLIDYAEPFDTAVEAREKAKERLDLL